MTQSIGRAKRYGQQKTVHIYRFVALRTADVDILQEREFGTLVKRPLLNRVESSPRAGSGKKIAQLEWSLVREDIIDEDVEDGWGSGYDFKSNPVEDEY